MAKKSTSLIRCIDCKLADFMQWFENPIIANCHERQERMVAESRHICPDYVPSGNPNPIVVHFDHYEKTRENEEDCNQ